MRAQVKHRLKVSYDDVKAVNPRIVYGSISGFGQDGPYGQRAGVDQIAQGMGGLMSITGLPGQGPVRVGIPIDDLTAGNLLALGIMMALFDRERTGVGRWVTTSLLEAQIFMLDFQAARWLMEGEVAGAGRQRPSDRHSHRRVPDQRRPHQHRRQSARVFDALLRGDRPAGLAGTSRSGRPRSAAAKHRKAINAAIGEITRTKPSEHWIELFEGAGIPCGPIYTIDQVFADPQVQASRHGDEDAQPDGRREGGGCLGDQHLRLLQGDPPADAGRRVEHATKC